MVRFTAALIDSEPSSALDLICGIAAGFVISGTSGPSRDRAVSPLHRLPGMAWQPRSATLTSDPYAGDKVPAAASEVDGCVDGLRITIAIPIQTSVRMVLTNANCETDNCRIAVPR